MRCRHGWIIRDGRQKFLSVDIWRSMTSFPTQKMADKHRLNSSTAPHSNLEILLRHRQLDRCACYVKLRNLKDQKIEVSSKEVGVILLKGTVPDEQSKIRAIEVAENTKGVNKVESELVEKISDDVAPKKAVDPKDAPEVKTFP